MSLEEILKEAEQAVFEGDEEAAAKVAEKVINEGLNPIDIINKGFTAGMHRVGDLFDKEEIPLPAVLIAAEAMTRAIEILGPHIPKDEVPQKTGKVVLGTIEGDIHDIGKRIVATMFRVSGFDVTDLGRDVPVKAFVEKAKDLDADIVGSSSLMTTTMAGQKILEEELRKAGIRDNLKTMVGGAATTAAWADRIGADCYAEDSKDAVLKAKELMG
jgi:trimethylamine corrinoid protein